MASDIIKRWKASAW